MSRVCRIALLVISLCVTFLCGCGVPLTRPDHLPATTCERVDNVRLIAASKLVFFGELHGTAESPTLIGEVACKAAHERPVVVALEWPVDLQSAVTKFLESKGEKQAADELLRHRFWRTEMLDGKSSASMLRLVDRLRFLRSQGSSIDIILFDDPVESTSQSTGRENRLADRLLNVFRARSIETQILVLTGNLHSRVTRGLPWNSDFEPAAYLLRNLKPLTFELGHTGGAAWNCGRDQCSSRNFKANLSENLKLRTPSLILGAEISDGHHGFFLLGQSPRHRPQFSRLPQTSVATLDWVIP